MADTYSKLDEKSYGSRYRYFEYFIEAPIEKVWPHALNIGGWMSEHRLETVAGEQGRVGHFERVYPRDLTLEVPLPHYHLYGIAEVIPKKYIALEVFPEKGGSYGNPSARVSFDNLLFTDIGGGRTKVVFLMIDVDLSRENAQKDESIDAQRKRDEETRSRLNRYFERLSDVVGK